MQLIIEFIIPKFIEGSTRFERHTAGISTEWGTQS